MHLLIGGGSKTKEVGSRGEPPSLPATAARRVRASGASTMLKGCRRGGRQVDVAVTSHVAIRLLILDVAITLLILIILCRIATHFSCNLFYNILQT
jgi:hypothetical protein